MGPASGSTVSRLNRGTVGRGSGSTVSRLNRGNRGTVEPWNRGGGATVRSRFPGSRSGSPVAATLIVLVQEQTLLSNTNPLVP